MKSNSLIMPIALLVVIGGLMGMLHVIKQQEKPYVAIGIIQTASHPALDALYKGFVDEASKLFDNMPELVWQNAQGAMSEAQTIAQSFHTNNNIKLVLCIATPAAQAMVNKESRKPIILTAVTDASILDIEAAQDNVCALEDRIDVPMMINFISHLLPHAQRAGLVYNPSEVNSVVLARAMEQALRSKGLEVLHVGLYHEQEITPALTSMSRKVDFFLAPTDNMVALSIDRIAQLTQQLKKPFIASDILLARRGATAACGVDYEQSGRLVARMAFEILVHGEKPSNLGIKQAPSFIVQDKERSMQLGISLVEDNNVSIIEEKEG